jgi:DNA ligase-1
MTVVKPPSFDDLVRKCGSREAAVKHLLDSGFKPEEIEWKMGVPYYLIRLFIAGVKLTNTVPFSSIVNTYERLAVVRSKKGKETELTKFFMREDLNLEVKIRLALGKVTDESLKIGPGRVEIAISLATGASINEVKQLLIDYGEHGEVVFLLKTSTKDSGLTAEEVYESIRLLPSVSRVNERDLLVSSLLRVASREEAKYIVRLLLLDLKLGYYESTIIRAAAKAYNVLPELITTAASMLGLTESLLLAPEGELRLSEVKLRPGQFLKPQLAQLFEPDRVSYPVRAEYKYDGARLQIHKWGSEVRLFSRQAVEKTETLPEAVEIAKKFEAQSCIVDSELVAVDEKGRLLPFQMLLGRTVPEVLPPAELAQRRAEQKVTIRAFDILLLNGRELTSLPLAERRKFLVEIVPQEYLTEGLDCNNDVELDRFYEEALRAGAEGIIVKSLSSAYSVGERASTWLKLKPERDTVDCTVVKALHGKGKRAGLYSSFLLAVRDPSAKKLYTIGKVSNLPDSIMEELKEIVERNRTGADDEGVFVKPSVVLEATYQEIQETGETTSGYSLRVPKVVRFRMDKTVDEIDDLKKLKKLFELQYERYPVQTL